MRRVRFDFSYLLSAGLLLAVTMTSLTGFIADAWDLNQFYLHSYSGYLMAGLVFIHVLLVGGRLLKYASWRLGWRGRGRKLVSHDQVKPVAFESTPAHTRAAGLRRAISAALPMTRRDFLQFLVGGAMGLAASHFLERGEPIQPAERDLGEAYHAWSKPGMANLFGILGGWGMQPPLYKRYLSAPQIHLPGVSAVGKLPVEEAILTRRSVREYQDLPMDLEELSRLLYFTGGINAERGGYRLRAAPSAGALYPIEIYAIIHRVEGVESGLYHYEVEDHRLSQIWPGDLRDQISRHGLMQGFLGQANLVLVFTGIFQRLRWRYQSRAYRYALLEAGHLGQNTYLAAASLGLAACAVAAFLDDDLNAMLGVDGVEEAALYILAVGKTQV